MMFSARAFHATLGLTVLVIHAYILLHHRTLLPGFVAVPGSRRAGTGYALLVGLPIAAAACFMFPQSFKRTFSPVTPLMAEYVLKEPFWYVLGYFLLLVSAAVLFLFSEAP